MKRWEVDAFPGASRPEGADPLNRAFRAAVGRLVAPDGEALAPPALVSRALRRAAERRLAAEGWDLARARLLLDQEPGGPDDWLAFLVLFAGLPPFPGLPDRWESCPAGTLEALAEAAATTDDGSTRYALGCLQLRGAAGEVVATDGRQILVQGGFSFPWSEDLLVPRTPLFSCRGLPRDQPVQIGKTDAHVVLRNGDWTLWSTIRPDARYPRVADVIPDERVPVTRLRLAPEDAAFLNQSLDRLPGDDALYAPATTPCTRR